MENSQCYSWYCSPIINNQQQRPQKTIGDNRLHRIHRIRNKTKSARDKVFSSISPLAQLSSSSFPLSFSISGLVLAKLSVRSWLPENYLCIDNSAMTKRCDHFLTEFHYRETGELKSHTHLIHNIRHIHNKISVGP